MCQACSKQAMLALFSFLKMARIGNDFNPLRLAKNPPQRLAQHLAIRLTADADAQVLVDARLLEVADDDVALA
jgi:hypothetical protein